MVGDLLLVASDDVHAARNEALGALGAPQCDVFCVTRFPVLPIVTYAVGSPNLFAEQNRAIVFARRVEAGEREDVQLLVRPHPIHDRNELAEMFAAFDHRIVVQRVAEPGRAVLERSGTSATSWTG